MLPLSEMSAAVMKPVTDMHQDVPKGKLILKYVKTFVGFCILVGSFFMPKYLGIDRIAAYVMAGFGGFLMSQDLVTKYLALIPSALKAIMAAKKTD